MPRKSGLRTQWSSRECARSTSSSIRRLQDVAVGSKDEGTHRDSCVADDALQGDPLWRALVTPGSMAEIKKMGYKAVFSLRLPNEPGADIEGEAAAARLPKSILSIYRSMERCRTR